MSGVNIPIKIKSLNYLNWNFVMKIPEVLWYFLVMIDPETISIPFQKSKNGYLFC